MISPTTPDNDRGLMENIFVHAFGESGSEGRGAEQGEGLVAGGRGEGGEGGE